MHQTQLANEVAETTGHQHQEKRTVEHLRGQLAALKGSEMNMIAEKGHRDLETRLKYEDINWRSMRRK